ncbi:MAG: peptidase T [Candidatus Riflebacteria bacterium]|nr:peptidase T [Candidatus Riflebacteria bacterium]
MNPEKIRRDAVERFMRYAAIETRSREGVDAIPSTPCQRDLAEVLEKELRELGLSDVRLDERCYVYATLPAKGLSKAPPIALIAHIDVSSAVSGGTVKPVLHANYQGGDLVLPGDPSVVIKAQKNPRLAESSGSDIITADGNTNLGADDKAGVAAIMAAIAWLVEHPEAPRGEVKIAFTPDEEVGRGAEGFDVTGVGAKYAYTVDGEQEGELNDETFNAAGAVVTFKGVSAHPGFAKGLMINSLYAAAHFIAGFPENQRPETTEKREGYLHPYELRGCEELTTLKVLLRDFDEDELNRRKQMLNDQADRTRKVFSSVDIDVKISDSYRNMNTVLRTMPFLVEYAEEAMRRSGVKPIKRPIRGGTDGARLTFAGLPTANIFCGAENCHSREEWLSARVLERSAVTLINLLAVWHERGN